tara:strand:+ start:1079 stop:1945 length:867 start_codon:yes stop_codon:yes gene_type:complete
MSSKYLKFDGDPFNFEQRLFCFVGDGGEDPTGADEDERIEIEERGNLLTPDVGRASRQSAGGGTVNFTVSQQAIDDMNQAGDEDSRQERRETFFGDATTDQRGSTISEAAIDDLLARGFAAGSRITPGEGVQANNQFSFFNDPIGNLSRAIQNRQAQGIRQQILAGGTPFTDDQGMIQGAMTPLGGFVGDQSLNPNPLISSDDSQPMQQMPPSTGDPQDPGTTTPETIDDAAINYLQNPFYLYSGQGNLYNPYGFAAGTLVDLLQSRGMRQPQQADTLGLFANPRDFM